MSFVDVDNFTESGNEYRVVALSNRSTRGSSTADSVSYLVEGVAPAVAAQAVVDHHLSVDDSLFADLQVSAEEVNGKWTLCEASVARTNPSVFRFNTTGSTTHINQSITTRGRYAAPGKTAPDFKGAIGVSDQGVAGVDITVPAFEFSMVRRFISVDTAYLLAIVSMTGRTNNGTWSIFDAEEALFLGAEGGETDQNFVDVAYHFSGRGNELTKTVGDIGPFPKRGWDYLWVNHEEEIDTTLQKVVQRPVSAHVEQVYPTGNFGVFGLT